MKIKCVIGDATQPYGDDRKIIVHVCNDIGAWGKGFVLALSKRWQAPEAEYRTAFKQDLVPQLGDVQFVEVEPTITVANIIGQHGIARRNTKTPPVRYEAVREGLIKVAEYAQEKHASVHMPRIGCGLAGGKWEELEPIIVDTLIAAKVSVTVYDFS